MAKISYRENANELEALYRRVLTPADRFVFSTIRVKKTLFSRKRLAQITQRSLLPEASVAWNVLTPEDQLIWKNSYSEYFRSGWNAFLKAFVERRKHGLSGNPSPNSCYLGRVGVCKIEAPANRLHLKQDHPNFFYAMTKVPKTKSQYTPVQVSEFARFPILFKIGYKTNLIALSSEAKARLYIRVYTDYQGRRLETDTIFDLALVKDWTRPSFNIEKPLGSFKGYEFHIDLYDVRGELYLDNLLIKHSGKNYARDPHFNSMRTTFTRKYYQVAKHYDIIDLPEGASFESVYYEN